MVVTLPVLVTGKAPAARFGFQAGEASEKTNL